MLPRFARPWPVTLRPVKGAVQGIGVVAVWASLSACGPDPGPVGWIDARAAVVRCTSAGRDRMPPGMLDLPGPIAPTGLYARLLDPMALDELGYQRDSVVCALLVPPTADDTRAGASSVEALLEARAAAGQRAFRAAGPCSCEVASGIGARALVPQCVDRPTQARCNTDAIEAKVLEALEPVQEKLAETRPPLMHWRLVGKTDRPGWFARQQRVLIERHQGGSTIYVEGQAISGRDNGPLLEALLELDDVVAVARQNSGQAILVVRELGDTLVLDHFAHPAVGPKLQPLLPLIDNASVARYRALLAKPTETRKLSLPPGKGNMVEIDISLLENVDEAVTASAVLAGVEPAAERELPARMVERVAVQAPFGHKGQRIEARLELTAAGTQWASLLTNTDLMPGLDELAIEAVEIPEVDSELPYVLAGTSLERSVVYGLEQVPELMSALEERYPASIGGTARAWSFTMPLSNMNEFVAESAGFSGLRTAFAERIHQIEVTVDDEGKTLSATVMPK